jgi:hypothetical protein
MRERDHDDRMGRVKSNQIRPAVADGTTARGKIEPRQRFAQLFSKL